MSGAPRRKPSLRAVSKTPDPDRSMAALAAAMRATARSNS